MSLVIDGHKKKAKKQKQPYTAPDSARSNAVAKMLIALSEGEVAASDAGILSDKDIYLDGVPIRNQDGTINHNVKWEFRSGTNDQDFIPALPMVESDTAAGQLVKTTTPWTRSITNTDVDKLRIRVSWQGLVDNKANGDRVGVTVDYAIDLATDGGSFQQVQEYRVSDKATSKYERSHSFDLPKAESGWIVRVRRITKDSTTDMIQDAMFVEAYTEIIDAKLTYPNTSLLYLEFSAEQFPQLPKVSVEMKGRIVRVPENYNPTTRTYIGVWNGRWKWAYTNNPAWCVMDLLVSDRFGAGERITLEQVDKWSLYEIARWCDVFVPDGKGGMEPRHTLNVYLQTTQDAWRVLGDIASVFNGVTYWNGQQLEVQADIMRDADFIYSRANTLQGKFSYSAISRKDKYTQLMVKYDNPFNEYETDTVPVNDIKLTRRFGVVQSTMAAFGCTVEGEAQRKGKYGLMTNYLDRMVSFQTGLDGYLPKLGRIIGVADNMLAGEAIGGRVKRVVSNVLTLDRAPKAVAGNSILINFPNGVSQRRNILSVTGDKVKIDGLLADMPTAEAVWAIDAGDLAVQLYKITDIKQNKDNQFTITAAQYDPKKFAYVDNGASLDDRPITTTPANEQVPPTSPHITQYSYTEQGMSVINVTLGWDAVRGAVQYEVQWRKDRMQWINVFPQSSTNYDIEGVYSGLYEFRVRAINAIDIGSTWATSEALQVVGKVGTPPSLAYLNAKSLVFGIELKWGFPSEGAKDSARTEIQYRALGGDDLLLGDFAYPTDTYTMVGLKAGVEFEFRGRLHDKTGNTGAWTSWVLGSSSADAGDILDYLAGQITESELGQSLLTPIQKIPTIEASVGGIETYIVDIDTKIGGITSDISGINSTVGGITQTVGSLGESVEGIITELGTVDTRISGISQRVTDAVVQVEADQEAVYNELSDLYAQIAQITGSDEYSPAEEYVKGSLIKFVDALYKAKQDVPAGIEPTNTVYWEKVGDYASLTDMLKDLALRVNIAETKVVSLDGIVTPMSTQLNSLRATTRRLDDWSDIRDVVNEWEAMADFTEEVTVRANQYEALSQRITNLKASLDEDISSQITLLEQVIANETEALALRLTAQEAGLLDAQADITETSQALATLDSATASALTTLSANFATNAAQIVETKDALATLETTTASAISTINTNFADSEVRITEAIDAFTAEDVALGLRISAAQAMVNANEADLRTEEIVRAGEIEALTQLNTVAQATADSGVAKAESNTLAISNLDTSLSRRVDSVSAATVTAQARADFAVSEASTKASEAEVAAKAYAESQAEAARLAAIATASGDATDKANAAQAEANRLAALDATNKANAAQAAAEDKAAQAQATADEAVLSSTNNAAEITRVDQALISAEGSLSTSISEVQAATVTAQETADAAVLSAIEKADAAQAAAELAANEYSDAQTEAARLAAIATASTDATDKANAAEAEAKRVAALDATEKANAAQAAAETKAAQAQATADAAKDTAEDAVSGVIENDAKITTAQQAITTVEEATAKSLGSLRATSRALDDLSSLADVVNNWQTDASFTEEVKVRTSQYEALAQRITELKAEVDTDISAEISILEQTIATETEALALRLTGLKAEVDEEISAEIQILEQTIATETEALALRLTELKAEVDGGLAKATSNTQAISNLDGALSQRIDTVSAATVTAQQTADQAVQDADSKSAASELAAKNYATTEAEAARLAAIATASGDATDKANAAEAEAKRVAALDATDKANAAQAAATLLANAAQAAADAAQAAATLNMAEISRVDQALITAEGALSTSISTVKAETVVAQQTADAKAAEAQKGVNANTAAIKNEATVRTTQLDSLGRQINTVQASVTSLDLASELDPIFPNGKRMNTDPTFLSGVGGVLPYDNALTGRVVVLRQSRAADNPSTSTHQLRVTITNGANPWYGGFLIPVQSRANAVFLVKYVIKLPAGYALETASNSMGTGYTDKFIGSSRGTGRYETYIRVIKCGASGAFDGGGHVYASGTGLTGTNVSYMYLSQVEIYDTTDFSGMTPEMTASIQTNSQAIANVDGTLKAQTTIKVQTVGTGGRKVITGIGLVADGQTGESSVLIQANRFGLISSLNGTQTTPFVVENGQTFINEAFIKDATLVNAIVRNRLVSAATDPQGRPLVDINFVTGEFFLRSFVVGQGRAEQSAKGYRVYDANDKLRVKIGDLR